jgi:hypothetical protein
MLQLLTVDTHPSFVLAFGVVPVWLAIFFVLFNAIFFAFIPGDPK